MTVRRRPTIMLTLSPAALATLARYGGTRDRSLVVEALLACLERADVYNYETRRQALRRVRASEASERLKINRPRRTK